ncbi:MAG: pentapeptide repeat-containing protein [Thermoplasmata archaeon]|nr:MAG: pentapeptide repeat-containing protein [Thermoplasmata archaeon]
MGNEEEGQARPEAEPDTEPAAETKVEAKPKTCTYEKVDGDRCQLQAMADSSAGLCMFHEPVASKDGAAATREFLKRVDAGDHDFEGYQLEDADLSGKVFHSDMIFRRAVFTGKTSFQEANFTEHAFFQDAEFKGEVDMGKARFANDVSFEDVTFRGETSFEEARFDGGSYWVKAVFKRDAVFKESAFGEEARFEEVRFGPHVDFAHAKFFGDVHFDDLRVEGTLYLGFAEFLKYAFFMEAEAQGKADFSFAQFMNYADFTRSKWKELNMTDVIFERRGCFDGSVIESGTFEDAELRHVTFRSVDMANVFTTGASLEEAYMSQAQWGTPVRGPLGKKLVVREETMANEEGTREALIRAEAAHRNLKESYKNEGDYGTAGEFFIREMDIRARVALMDREYGYWVMSKLISGLCGYGERPTRVIFWWFAFTFTFAIIYFTGQLIQYSDGVTEIDFGTLSGFLTCFYFSVVTFTTLGFGDISPVTDLGRGVASVEAFTGAFMIALFVLVFGRKMIR